MTVEQYGKIPGLKLIKPDVFMDERGIFFENYRANELTDEDGNAIKFVQGNVSKSNPFVLRGLHWQIKEPQGKLLTCLRGSIQDVAVDLRQESPTYGCYESIFLNEQNNYSFYIPPGFAHGYLALDQGCSVSYQCTTYFRDVWSRALRWNDDALDIRWLLGQGRTPTLSNKDRAAPTFSQVDPVQV